MPEIKVEVPIGNFELQLVMSPLYLGVLINLVARCHLVTHEASTVTLWFLSFLKRMEISWL